MLWRDGVEVWGLVRLRQLGVRLQDSIDPGDAPSDDAA
jgi:hypothetical protein